MLNFLEKCTIKKINGELKTVSPKEAEYLDIDNHSDIEKLQEQIKILKEENKEFSKVLTFYANRRNFDFQNEKELRFCNSDDQADVFQPFGTKAREILKKRK